MIVTNVGGLPEVVEIGKSGFVCEPTAKDISQNIIDLLNSDLKSYNEFISGYKNNFSWSSFSKNMIELANS